MIKGLYFLSINSRQFKKFDFIILTNFKLNIELNEQIFMNIHYLFAGKGFSNVVYFVFNEELFLG